jgi:succinyl-CoA synthetase alpha subunit
MLLIEAMESGIKNIVIYSEGVPFHDSLYMVNYAKLTNTMIFGPNSAGVVSPGKANVSDLNDAILKEGNIGIVSKSGTLTYEVIELLEKSGLGISTVACLGGDPIIGTNYVDVLKKFNEDDETKLVIMLGEIGGQLEIKAAEYIKHMKKPVISYIVGQSAPPTQKNGARRGVNF